MRFIKLCSLVLLLLLLIILSANGCGRRGPGAGNAGTLGGIMRVQEPVEVLTLMGHEFHYYWFMLAERRMAEAWRETGRGEFVLELTLYSHENELNHFISLQTMLAAGYGYDMFMLPMGFQIMVHFLAKAGHLADIFGLIDQCRYRGRDDYFTNAFNMFTTGERLYGFPLVFSFEYVAINTKLPEHFIDMFKSLSYITTEQLIQFYLELMDHYPQEFGHLEITNSVMFASLYDLVHQRTTGFVDFEAGTSNLTDQEFINYLEYVRRLVLHDGLSPGVFVHDFRLMSQEEMNVRAAQFAFWTAATGNTAINAFFPPEEDPYFTHFIPLSNECGELIARTRLLFCFSETGNSTLAWEFMQYLQDAFADAHQNFAQTPFLTAFDIPVARDLFDIYFENWFSDGTVRVLLSDAVYRFDENSRDDALARLYRYSQMPISPLPVVPLYYIFDITDLLINDIINAENAAHRLHNMVESFLSERR